MLSLSKSCAKFGSKVKVDLKKYIKEVMKVSSVFKKTITYF